MQVSSCFFFNAIILASIVKKRFFVLTNLNKNKNLFKISKKNIVFAIIIIIKVAFECELYTESTLQFCRNNVCYDK